VTPICLNLPPTACLLQTLLRVFFWSLFPPTLYLILPRRSFPHGLTSFSNCNLPATFNAPPLHVLSFPLCRPVVSFLPNQRLHKSTPLFPQPWQLKTENPPLCRTLSSEGLSAFFLSWATPSLLNSPFRLPSFLFFFLTVLPRAVSPIDPATLSYEVFPTLFSPFFFYSQPPSPLSSFATLCASLSFSSLTTSIFRFEFKAQLAFFS